MTKAILCHLLLLAVSTCFAQQGTVQDHLTLTSKILKMERKYAVYLPPGYTGSTRSYPVLYLLHGSGDDQTGWVQFGEVQRIANKAIQEGLATEMIIIMPDANEGKRGYFNSLDGNFRYEDFFFQELIPFVEKTYRVRSEKRYRAVAGLSMGGGGTLIYALHRPDMFGAACAMSTGGGLQDLEQSITMYKKGNPTMAPEQVEAYAKRYNGFSLVDSLPDDQLKAVRWYIDCGDDDSRSDSNSRLHIAMKKRGIPHEFRIRDGGHTWTFWRASLTEVLAFITPGFHQF